MRIHKREKKYIVYFVIGAIAFLVAMAPVYWTFASRYIFMPLWRLSATTLELGDRLGHAIDCFTYTPSVNITAHEDRVLTSTGAYTYGYITGVRWLGDIKEFYIKTATKIPKKVDAVVVDASTKGFIGKVDRCDKKGCWVVSLWDSHLNVPVYLKPSGYIGWLKVKDGNLLFYSVSAPLSPVSAGQGVYWLGNPIVKVGITTSTLSVSTAHVKPIVSHLIYHPVFVYTEVLSP